ncbi:MAG: hypothetical protein IPL78_33705 [Chloroflexi bacterium]|nr:hypothetical protein [Chloroflexota bacterium]
MTSLLERLDVPEAEITPFQEQYPQARLRRLGRKTSAAMPPPMTMMSQGRLSCSQVY